MGLLRSLVVMLLLLFGFLWLPGVRAQVPNSTSALDAILQNHAYQAFGPRPKTGTIYNGAAPPELNGIKIAAVRLRSGSFRRKGIEYKEFKIVRGVIERPYVERLVLVYQNLGNWSHRYYQLPNHDYLAPVLGLLAYNGSNLSATDLSVLDIRATGDPITIEFPDVRSAPDGLVAKCVWFDLQGSPNFSSVTSSNECSAFQQGHFSIVVESIAPAPSIEPVSPPPSGGTPEPSAQKKKSNSKVGIIVGSVLGGVLLLVLLSFLVLWVQKLKEKKKMQQMEKAADVGEALQMTSVGETRAPAAMVTRTQPTLENEYVP